MELTTEEFPTCVAVSNNGRFVLGSVDGSIRMATFNLAEETVDYGWQFNMKGPLRKVIFNQDGTQVLSVSRNRAVCSYDVETGVRTRCIVEGTKGLPTSICLIPPTAPKHQFATGCENGQVCTWDFRVSDPKIYEWKEQAEDINALAMDTRHCLLSASADGTLAAFDMRKRKLRVKSEVMASELLSVCVSDKYVYAGGSDGCLEVFNIGEYGNIVGRVESGFDMGVNDIIQLRRGLLLTTSESSNCLRLLNVQPNKQLGIMRKHGGSDVGVDTVAVSPDHSTLISLSSMSSSLMMWSLEEILENIPVLRADKIEKRKQPSKEQFFDDLIDSHKKRKVDSDSEDDDEEDFDEEDDDEENDAEEELDEDENAMHIHLKKGVGITASEDNKDESEEDDDDDEELDEEIETSVRQKVPVPIDNEDTGEGFDDEEIDEDEEEDWEEGEPVMISPKPKTPPPRTKTPQSIRKIAKAKTPQSARKTTRKGTVSAMKGKAATTQKPRWKY